MNMSILNLNEFFWKISVGVTAFRWKIVVISLNSKEKIYGNGTSAVLRRLAAVSAKLPAILEKKANLKKFRPS